MGLSFNLDLNFDKISLDKLYTDANKSGALNVSNGQTVTNTSYGNGTANTYGGTSSVQTETLDLSASVTEGENASVSINNSAATNSTNVATDTGQTASNVNINTTSSTPGSNSTTTTTSNSTTIDPKNSNSIDVNNGDTTNNQSGAKGNDAESYNGSPESNKDNTNSNSSNINSTSSSGVNNNTSSVTTNSSQGNAGSNNNGVEVDIDIDIETNATEPSEGMTVQEGKVMITTVDSNGQEIEIEIAVDDYVNTLKSYGLRIEDINRIINGEITVEELFKEIENDPDTSRYQEMMESSYLQAYGFEFTSMAELKDLINKTSIELNKLIEQKEELESKEIELIQYIIEKLKRGGNLDDILKEPVAWQYIDENGNICYRYDNPYALGLDPTQMQVNYLPVTFEALYKDSELLDELRAVLSIETKKEFVLFGDEETVYCWNGSNEQKQFLENLVKERENLKNRRDNELDEINKKINQLEQEITTYQVINDRIDSEISHYINNIHKYISKTDYYTNNKFNPDSLKIVDKIKGQYTEFPNIAGQEIQRRYINEKSEIVDVISCMINQEGALSGNFFIAGTTTVELLSTDSMLEHYANWASLITEEEKQIFNYIYNTEGTDAAYKYLEDISDTLDYRWLDKQRQEDQEFASENKFLASVGSIFVTPIEGISAACYSMNSIMTGEKIRRTDVYSAGTVWRGQVATDIAENYGEGWSFTYSTAMSMADTGVLIAANAATGGTATPVLSATLMGSRSYVSTLNDALNKGLSDGQAVALAGVSAIVESAMESYSVGHLVNLESVLGATTQKLTTKIATTITDPTLASLATKTMYIAANALSQGICEGEEEFTTEILNYVTDMIISGDLSDHTLAINNYMSQGYTEEEARKMANEQFGSQLFQAFAGGFASGLCFGTFGGINTTQKTSYGIAHQMYGDLQATTPAEQFAKALEVNQSQIEAYTEALEAVKNGETLTVEQIALLNTGTVEMQASSAIKEERTQNIDGLISKVKDTINHDSSKVNIKSEVAEMLSEASESTEATDFVTNSMEVSEDIVYESSETNINQSMLEQVSEVSTNLQKFADLLAKIRQYTDSTVPDGYETVADYKRDFIRTIIDSGKINELDNNYIYQLARDPIMFSELIATGKLNNLYTKNLSSLPKLLVPTLSALEIDDFNRFFNTPTMVNYINSLNAKELGEILKLFQQSNNSNVSWLANDAIINKIISLDVSEFYTLIDSLGYYSLEIKKYIKSGNDISNYLKLLETIKTKFYTQEVLLDEVAYKDKINNILATYTNNSEIDTIVKTIQLTQKDIKNIITNAIISSSDVEIIAGSYSTDINVDPNYKYYNIAVEIDGHTELIGVSQVSGKINIDYSLINKVNYAKAALQGTLKIKEVSVNTKKSNLVLTETMGLKTGLNEVTLLLDGIERQIIVSLEKETIDLNYDYSEEFENIKDIQVKSVKPLGNLNINVDDSSALYIISYEIEGKKYEGYIKPDSSIFSKTGENTLNINKFISDNSLFGAENIEIRKATQTEIKDAFPIISEYKASSNIYSDTKFGGNQSDVTTIITESINGTSLSLIDIKKAEILNKLIDKYFPNATDIQKINLATHYAKGGCCWMAVANAFATYMGSIENGSNIFKDKIGFDLTVTDGNTTSYNLEAIAFDMYLSYFSKTYNGNVENLLNSNIGAGISAIEFDDKITTYFVNRGINIQSNTTVTLSNEQNLNNELIQKILNNKNGFSILSASNFDIKLVDKTQEIKDSLDQALISAKTDGNIKRGVGGHAMLVTGIDENMNLLVSSWGRQYQFLAESIAEYKALGKSSNASIWTINFSIPSDSRATSVSVRGTDTTTTESANTTNIDYYVNQIKAGMAAMNAKYGKDIALSQLSRYITTGDLTLISSAGGFRNLVRNMDHSTLIECYNQIIDSYRVKTNNNFNTTTISQQKMKNDILSLISKHDKKYGTGDAIKRLSEFANPQSSYYKNYDIISSNLGARSILKNYTPTQISDVLISLGYSTNSVQNNTSVNNVKKSPPINPTQYMASISQEQLNRNFKYVVSEFVSGIKNNQNLYNVIIHLNSIKKSIPSQSAYQRYINRTSKNNYLVVNQRNYFRHVSTEGFNNSNVTHRLYINAEFNDTYKFLELFADKCEEQGLNFHFKTAFMHFGTEQIAPSSSLTRTESAVIYASEDMIIKYTEICREIKKEHPEISFYSPPTTTASIDGWLGYGMEPNQTLMVKKLGKQQSYNTLRSIVIKESIIEGIKDFIDLNGNFTPIKDFTTNDLYIYELFDYIQNNYSVDKNSLYEHLFKYKEYYVQALKQGQGFRVGNINIYSSQIKTININLFSNYLSNIPEIYEFIKIAIKKLSPEYGIDPNNFTINIS